MGMKLKKLWPLFGAMCVSLFASASADNYQYGSSSQTNGSTQQTDQGMYQRGTYREITPAAGPRVAHGADVFITADFIWWKTVQEGTTYATSGGINVSSFPAFTGTSKGRVKEVGNDWDPGFQVGLGLNLCHDGWDLYAQYTWLRPENHSSTSAEFVTAQTLVPVVGNRATAKWDLHFNVIDLEMGRNFYLSQFFTMRPFLGFKGTWQDQDTRYKYYSSGFTLGSTVLSAIDPYQIHEHFDVWGIGVRGGFNVAWYMSKNWSFYSNLALTTMWASYYDHSRKDQIMDTAVFYIDGDDHYSVKYIGELELGLRWEMWFYDDNYHFAIQAGWEQQVWVNWANHIELYDEVWSDLNFHGLNLKFRFDF